MENNLTPNDKGKVGVYLIQNDKTLETYVGSGVLDKRKYRHEKALFENKHINFKLQRAYNRNSNFDFVGIPVEEPNLSKEENRKLALDLEQQIIDEFKDSNLLLNISLDTTVFTLGLKHSPESKEKISKKSKDYWNNVKSEDLEKRNKLISYSKKEYFKSLSEEDRNILSEKIRQANLGKITPQDIKDKISASLKGRIITEEHKNKISKSNKNVPKSKDAVSKGVETRMKNDSYKHSEESILKVSKLTLIDGIEYPSRKLAAEKLNISRSTLYKRLNEGEK